jgi:hypothetical protein
VNRSRSAHWGGACWDSTNRPATDPADTGEHEWHGWQDTRWLRRQWDEDGLLSQDRGMLMVAHGDDTLGYVGWHRRATGGQSSYWEIEIGLAPEARGHGHGTGPAGNGSDLARASECCLSASRHDISLSASRHDISLSASRRDISSLSMK